MLHAFDAMFDDDLPPDLYTIRLQGPWQSAASVGEPPRRIRLPFDDHTGLDGPAAVLTRTFQRPTNLDRDERVLLILPAGLEPQRVALTGRVLDAPRRLAGRLVWDLTDRLERANQLELAFDRGDWVDALREPVLLGIMPDADGSWWESLPAAGDRLG